MARGPADAAPGPSPWRDLRVRAASAAILAPLSLAALWWGGAPWNVLIVAVGIGMGAEWLAMSRTRAHPPAVMLGLGLLYVFPAVAALIWLRGLPETGRAIVLFVMLVVWASDIGAYLAGRLVGGPKLAPVISPGKTWSGAAGGLIAAVLVGVTACWIWGVPLGWGPLVAGLLGLVSQAGDLLESAIKRHFGVKDSGRSIPGHGGLLDRLDGVLTAAPTAALLVWILGQGKVLWQ